MNAQCEGNVVVGVAESMLEGGVLRWAAEQARLEGRDLTLLHASSAGPRRFAVQLLDKAQATVEELAGGPEVHRFLAATDPATLLLDAATTAHLVVLGSRGRGPLRSHLLGSVGQYVVQHAPCPVVVHRPGDHPGRVHRGVVVGADASTESRPVLEFAFRLAAMRRLPLHVVHYVYDVRAAFMGVPMVADLREDVDEHQRLLAESVSGFGAEYPDVFLTVETLRGYPERELAGLSQRADLTVLGRHSRHVLDRALGGSVSTAVLEHAHGPVAFVPQAG